MDWSAYAREQGLGREVGDNLARAAQLSRSPVLTTGDLLRALVRDTGHAGTACAALGLEPARVESALEELALAPEPLLRNVMELSGPTVSATLHVQDEGNLLGLQTSGALLLTLRPDRPEVASESVDPLDTPGHGELALEMLGIGRLPLRAAVLEAIARSHPDTRDWETRSQSFLRLSRFHTVYPYPGEKEPPPASAEAVEEAARLSAMAVHYLHASAEDLKWLGTALYDERKKWFVVRLVRMTESLPQALLEPLVCAAIYEQDPSRNRHFVEAAVHGVGQSAVHERLLWYMRQGVDAEKSGAMRALYWCPPPDAASVKETARWLLDAFIRESDLDVQRNALSKLALIDWRAMDAGLQARLGDVLHRAASHPDVYIRHRADVLRGEAKDLLPQPAPAR
ncbi:hypothetical protein [Hyalangium rubrum]|uniref:HEAT repeat domain-containing protein n=1 Tax=Hyalangium rubrum TaxID=3103134 RepID=A0ABU5H193_9BACT|nr:hypothetical protein [Hyalangium sp. s54d21]MDY7226694.1 hypothetical protein [Hyalangium sp. s54d21]